MCVSRFGKGLTCASLGCMPAFSLSPWATHLVSVAHPPSAPLVPYLASVGLFSRHMLQACPSPCAMPTRSLGARSQAPSPTGTALQTTESSLLAEVSLHRCSASKGALTRRACTLASLFNLAICRLSKISQWEEQQRLKLLILLLICSRGLFPCPRLSACSHSGGCSGGSRGALHALGCSSSSPSPGSQWAQPGHFGEEMADWDCWSSQLGPSRLGSAEVLTGG